MMLDHNIESALFRILYKAVDVAVRQQNRPDTPNMTIGLSQHIKVEESTSIQWVNTLMHQEGGDKLEYGNGFELFPAVLGF